MSSLRFDRRLLAPYALAFFVPGSATAAEIDARVSATAGVAGSADAILVFADQSQPALPLRNGGDYRARSRALVDALRARAEHAQHGVRAWLDAHGIEHRDYWIANLIQARLPA